MAASEMGQNGEIRRKCAFADGYRVAEGVGERQPRCTQLTSSPLGETIIITVTSGTVGDIVVISARRIDVMTKRATCSSVIVSKDGCERILIVYAERGLDRLAMAAKVHRQGGGSSQQKHGKYVLE
jgi:hypothetical protein